MGEKIASGSENVLIRRKTQKRDGNSTGKEESQKRSLKAGRAKGRGAKETFCPGPEFYTGSGRVSGKRTEKKKFASGPLFLSAALKAGDETQNRIHDENIVCIK